MKKLHEVKREHMKEIRDLKDQNRSINSQKSLPKQNFSQ